MRVYFDTDLGEEHGGKLINRVSIKRDRKLARDLGQGDATVGTPRLVQIPEVEGVPLARDPPGFRVVRAPATEGSETHCAAPATPQRLNCSPRSLLDPLPTARTPNNSQRPTADTQYTESPEKFRVFPH